MRFVSLRRLRALLASCVLLLCVTPALAQPEKEIPFHDVNIKTHVKPMVPWVIAVGFMVVSLLIAIKNPHRSHLD